MRGASLCYSLLPRGGSALAEQHEKSDLSTSSVAPTACHCTHFAKPLRISSNALLFPPPSRCRPGAAAVMPGNPACGKGTVRPWCTIVSAVPHAFTRCVTTTTEKGADAELVDRRRDWYRRQLRAHTLNPVDLLPLAQREPSSPLDALPPHLSAADCRPENADSRLNAMTEAFLSCCASSMCESATLHSIFEQLPSSQQCAILANGLARESLCSLPLLMECASAALRTSNLTARQWMRVLSAVRKTNHTQPLPVCDILVKLFKSPADSFACTDDARALLSQALSFLETQKTPRKTIVTCLETCNLPFEASAYACTESYCAPSTCVSHAIDGWGFGSRVHALCALPRAPLKEFRALRRTMPPVVRRYATLLLLQSVVQRSKARSADATEETWLPLTDELLSPLEAASAIHFLLDEGSTATARWLLPRCRTSQQVATLMRYTKRVDLSFTFEALKKLSTAGEGQKVLVHLRFRGRQCAAPSDVLFEAQAEEKSSHGTLDDSCRLEAPSEAGATDTLAQTFSLGCLERGLLRRCLREALPCSVLSQGERSLGHVLTAVPPAAVEHVARSLPAVRGDAFSWWACLYLKSGNTAGALAVLEVLAGRGCMPHMGVLVELLESVRNREAAFVRAVRFVRESFPTAADTVLRAYVERTAAVMTETPVSAFSVTQAVESLTSLAMLGILQSSSLNQEGRQRGERGGSATSVTAAAQAVRLSGTRNAATTAVPLCVTALHGLVVAGETLNLGVSVSVVVLPPDGGDVSWWSTATTNAAQTLTQFVYATQSLSLWPLVRDETLSGLPNMSTQDLHKAVRIVALGSRNPEAALAVWRRVKRRLIREEKKATGRRNRRMHDERASVACTKACLRVVCQAYGGEVHNAERLNGDYSNDVYRCSVSPAAGTRAVEAHNECGEQSGASATPPPAEKTRKAHKKCSPSEQGRASSILDYVPRRLRRLLDAAGLEVLNAAHSIPFKRHGRVKSRNSS